MENVYEVEFKEYENLMKTYVKNSNDELIRVGPGPFLVKESDLKKYEAYGKGIRSSKFVGIMDISTVALAFSNELVNRLNNNASRYVGGTCNGHEYPCVETFDVDEVYEIIDRVLKGIPEDDGSCD